MSVIAVAGMPGSGKTTIMETYGSQGYIRYDDINRDWHKHMAEVRNLKAQGKSVIVSDIMLCHHEWRARLVQETGGVDQWIYFANDPYQCSLNVLARAQEKQGNWIDQLHWISKLTSLYAAPDNSIPIFVKATLTVTSKQS